MTIALVRKRQDGQALAELAEAEKLNPDLPSSTCTRPAARV